MVEELDEVASRFGHAKQQGVVLSAAVIALLRMTADEQMALVKSVASAEIADEVDRLIAEAKTEQARRAADQLLPTADQSISSMVEPQADQAPAQRVRKVAKRLPREHAE